MTSSKLLFLVLTLFIAATFQAHPQKMKWSSFDELIENMRKQPRPIVIFIHTDWCKFCAMQENNTFSHPTVVKQLNEKCYAVRLNAEERNDIMFLNKKYHYKPSGAGSGYHQLAEMLARKNGKLTLPSTVILSEAWQIVHKAEGFLTSDELLRLLAQ